jgi:hypothetical protein
MAEIRPCHPFGLNDSLQGARRAGIKRHLNGGHRSSLGPVSLLHGLGSATLGVGFGPASLFHKPHEQVSQRHKYVNRARQGLLTDFARQGVCKHFGISVSHAGKSSGEPTHERGKITQGRGNV